ncbi:hypothetical protein Psuf_028070 [Phytohabitans suffuscus]|uniref:Uncharacterized protein n=1 Tax=Phytohabitans suffuscus TaxID=624315 RepID=A0A6F8YH75_9ACTN|nr:hypothetical protein Psuf_028070 [Phytohabitans suffuscus]
MPAVAVRAAVLLRARRPGRACGGVAGTDPSAPAAGGFPVCPHWTVEVHDHPDEENKPGELAAATTPALERATPGHRSWYETAPRGADPYHDPPKPTPSVALRVRLMEFARRPALDGGEGRQADRRVVRRVRSRPYQKFLYREFIRAWKLTGT